MAGHKFEEFLRSREWDHALHVDFVDWALRDPQLPDAESWEQLEAHLAGYDAPARALSAAKFVWQQYERAIERER